MKAIEVQNLTRDYKKLRAVDDISFSVEPGEIFLIIGGSGCGVFATPERIRHLRPFPADHRCAGSRCPGTDRCASIGSRTLRSRK